MHRTFTCLALLSTIAATPVAAGDHKPAKSSSGISEDEIIKALTPKPKNPTKVEGIPATRNIAIEPAIPFDTNSAALNRAALAALERIGPALKDEHYANTTFVVAGHADGSGNKNYNLDLSERRADAVKHFLVETYGLSPAQFVTVGYSQDRLKDTSHPAAAENRRVEIVVPDVRVPPRSTSEPVENGSISNRARIWLIR